MAQVRFIKGLGIASISGRLGNCIFYTRNGKQYVRSTDPNNRDLPAIIEPTTSRLRAVNESFTSHLRAINESDPVLK